MMASIPNMRSTPLPVPAGKTGTAEAAPGDFAAQLPIAREKVVPLVAPETQQTGEGAELVVPDIAEAIAADEGETPEATSETPDAGETAKATPAEIVIPFLQVPPQVQAPVSADEAVPAETQAPVVQASTGKRAGRACGPGDGKAALPLPTVTDAPAAKTDAPKPEVPQLEAEQIETVVNELLQRKQEIAKPVVAAPKAEKAETAKPETAPVEAKGQIQPQVQAPSAPAAIQTAGAIPASVAIEQPQPALAPLTAQPAVAKADASGTVEATRTTDLAVERQLDLARGTEWLDRLARDIARAGASDQPLRFRLHPQTLGHLQVELQQGDHGTAVRLTVETEAARQLLADAQPRLAAEARAQGVRIAETHVDLSGSGRHAPGDQRRQEEARQTPFVRTAPGAGEDVVASARASRRARLDRYA